MMENRFCVDTFRHSLIFEQPLSCLSFKSSYTLLGLHFLASLLSSTFLLPDFGPSFTQTIKWVVECFVELLAFCKVLVFRNTCYVRVAVVAGSVLC